MYQGVSFVSGMMRGGGESGDVVPEAWASQTCLGLSIKKGERLTAPTLGGFLFS